MPRVRFKAGDTVAWDLAGYTFTGEIDRFVGGRQHGQRSVILRFAPDDYDRYGKAIQAWSDRERAVGNPHPPLEFPEAWVYENLVEERGWYEFALHIQNLRLVDPANPPSRERIDPDHIPVEVVPGRTVRLACVGDAEQIARVHLLAAGSELDAERLADLTARHRAHLVRLVAEPIHMSQFGAGPIRVQPLVCEHDGEIVGLCSYGMWELHSLFVHPDHQGQGVGRALLSAALNGLREDGAHHARVELPDSITAIARAFLERAGFHEVPYDLHSDERGRDLPVRLRRALT